MPLYGTFGLLIFCSLAQALPVHGRLRELGTSNPVVGGMVTLQGTTLSVESGPQGRWSFDLPPGLAALSVSAENFSTQSFTLAVTASAEGQSLDAGTQDLTRLAFDADVVTVRAHRDTEAPSHVAIHSKEIRRIAGIERDPLRALQTLPGVVAVSDFSGQLSVRGGGPQDNAYFINEVPWPIPFHYGGALSTVHSDFLEGVDFYPAAFPPRWGGVDGAILDAHSRPPKRDGFHGQVDVNLLLTEGLLEGPLSPSATGGWLVSGRRSYLELLLGHLSSFTAVPRFWDLSALVDYDVGLHDHLRFTGLATDDVLALELTKDDVGSKDFEGEFRYSQTAQSAGINWVHDGDLWRSTLTPYGLRNAFGTSFGKGYGVSTQPTIGGVDEELRREWGAHEIGLGGGYQAQRFEVFGYFFRRATGAGSGYTTVSDPHGITISALAASGYFYAQDRVTLLPGLRLLGGLRWQRSDHMNGDSLDPRVNLEWKALPATTFTAGWGIYSRFPNPRELSIDFGNPALGFNRTEHVVAGVEQEFGAASSLKVEGYYKTFRDEVVEVPDSRIFANAGQGFAPGVDVLLRHEISQRFFGWISYSYARSRRLNGPGLDWQDYQYDQPHTLTVVGSYDISPAWSGGLKLNYHSGPLITPIIGSYSFTNSDGSSGWNPVYGAPYSRRLDDYLRLDVRTDYAFRLRGAKVNLYAEVINLLDRPNPAGLTYSKDFSQAKQVDNLQRLPYFGVGLEF